MLGLIKSFVTIFKALSDKYKYDNSDKVRFKQQQNALMSERWMQFELRRQIQEQLNLIKLPVEAVIIKVDNKAIQFLPSVEKMLNCKITPYNNLGDEYVLKKVDFKI